MNRTSIPGFTAEASLYRTSGHYLTAGGGTSPSTGPTSAVQPAMINEGGGVNCGNCVGGECAELHCFENWTHGGGGPEGPYGDGGGGGGGFGGGGGGSRGCVDNNGRTRPNGTVVVTTVHGPGGGIEDTYVIRQRCSNGAWVDVGY